MVKVLFSQTRVVQDGTGTTFEAGKVYDLSRASADRWIIRGIATEVPGDAPPALADDQLSDLASAVDSQLAEAEAIFDPKTADEPELRAFLTAHGVTPHHRAGEPRLREMAVDVIAKS